MLFFVVVFFKFCFAVVFVFIAVGYGLLVFFNLAAQINFDLEGSINGPASLSGPEGCSSTLLPNCSIVTTSPSDPTDIARRNYCLAFV